MKSFLTGLGFLILAGCASITVNPATGDVKYLRIGDQNIQGLAVEKTKTGLKVTLEGQQSQGEALTEAIKVIGSLAGTPK